MSEPTLGPGQYVGTGSYRLLSSLGLGGFAEVFLADGPEGLVAIKVVETALWNEREYRVFNALMVSEASFLSTLDHPALPKLRAFFAEGSRYFLVMDWVRGQTLEEFVKSQGQLSIEQALLLLEQSLEVLGYLHDRCCPAVVFGDLKPANLLRTYDGKYRFVDLGLASLEGTCMTGGFAVYSPPYSAPELAGAVASSKSHDIYSLSATMLYALTGLLPSKNVEVSVRNLFERSRLRLPASASKTLGQLLTLLLAGLSPDCDGRPANLSSFTDLLQRLRVHCHSGSGLSSQQNTTNILRGLYDPPLSP